MSEVKEAKRRGYPREMYVAYSRSVQLAMERRLMDLTPENSAVFWEWFIDEINIGRERMRNISTQVRKTSAPQVGSLKGVPVLVRKGNKPDTLGSQPLSQNKQGLIRMGSGQSERGSSELGA